MPSDEENASSSEDESESSSSSSEEEVELPPPLAPNRSRRLNAGNRMAKVLAEDEKKGEGDEVYDTLYGGFKEVEDDANFEVSSDDSSDDENEELDKQSDAEEQPQEDEEGAAEEDEKEPKKKKKRKQVESKPSWIVSQMSDDIPLNQLTVERQAKRLKECQSIAQANRESLQAMLKKQKEEQEKRTIKARPRFLQGPKESYISNKEGTFIIKPEIKNWKSVQEKVRKCVVSGNPAHYVDWLTGLPFLGAEEFRTIRNSPKLNKIRPKQTVLAKSVNFAEQPSTSSGSLLSEHPVTSRTIIQVDEDTKEKNSSIIKTLMFLNKLHISPDAEPFNLSPKDIQTFRSTVLNQRPPRTSLPIMVPSVIQKHSDLHEVSRIQRTIILKPVRTIPSPAIVRKSSDSTDSPDPKRMKIT